MRLNRVKMTSFLDEQEDARELNKFNWEQMGRSIHTGEDAENCSKEGRKLEPEYKS